MRVVIAAVAALLACACTEWHAIPRAPNGFYPTGRLARAKIALANGSSMKIDGLQIRGDSVVGTDPASGARAAFSVRDISRIDTREYSRPRTLFLVGVFSSTILGVDLYMVGHR